MIQFVRQDAMAVLEVGTDTREVWDPLEDSRLSLAEQAAESQTVFGRVRRIND
jgi:hypothetical protein